MNADFSKGVTRREGLELMCENWPCAPERELVPLAEALGRVTAEDIFSVNTLPVCRSSCFDGIAVNSAAFADGMPDTSGWVKGRDFVRADTGDDFPDEFDAVIAVEDVEFVGENGVRFREGYVYDGNKNVNPSGKTVRAGDLLVRSHTRITAELLAALAIGGCAMVPVLRRPRVAFLPTGSELVPAGTIPARGQNVDANSLLVGTLLKQWGAEPVCHPICPDRPEALLDELSTAIREFDIIIINGGSSRGEEDFCARLLRERGSFFRHGVRAAPGRPVGMAIVDGKPVVNVPGPVLAAYFACHWLVAGLVAHYYGVPVPRGATVRAKLATPVKKRGPAPFEMLVRVKLESTEEGIIASAVNRDAGIISILRETNGMVVIPIETVGYEVGQEVEVELLGSAELIS